jgi:NADH-quinone oxidoreductase subunit J
MYEIVFYIFAAICLISGAVVVLSRKIAHAAFALLFTFFGVGGIYVLLGADFVGVAQLLIYVGGILVLFLFGMMLTANIDRLHEERAVAARVVPGVILSSAMGALLGTIAWTVPAWRDTVPRDVAGGRSTSALGELLMGDYALLFIVSAIAILVALVGAAMIARSDRMTPEDAMDRM